MSKNLDKVIELIESLKADEALLEKLRKIKTSKVKLMTIYIHIDKEGGEEFNIPNTNNGYLSKLIQYTCSRINDAKKSLDKLIIPDK